MPTGPLARRLILPFAAGYYLSYLLRTVNAVISPELTRELGLTAGDLGLLTSAYFLAFGAAQIPLGILLDRYGPQRVEAALLLVAAAGAALFAMGDSLLELTLARALLGFGVSACLMAGLKTFSLWFPRERQASLTGTIMAAGGLGALTASVPLELALPIIGWRGAFWALAVLSVVLAAVLYAVVPDRPDQHASGGLRYQLHGVLDVLRSRDFWRFVPQAAFFTGGFMAVQGLWAVPWLMTVNGYGRDVAADHLFALNLAMLSAQFGIATLATRLGRRGVTPLQLLITGLGLALLWQLLIVLEAGPTLALWFGFGLCVSTGALMYTVLSGYFPPLLSGRVMTTINLAAFAGAFGIQWGLGLLIDALQRHGLDPTEAHRASFLALLALQGCAWVWLALGDRGRAPSALN